MRKPNGGGCIFHMAGNRRKPWAVRVTTGWTSEGKQIREYIGFYETNTEARRALAKYLESPIGFNNKITFGEIYETFAKQEYSLLKKKTVAMYETAWNHLSVLSDTRITDIKKSHIQAVITSMTDKGLGYSSCHKVKVLAGRLFNMAIDDDIIHKDHSSVRLPERKQATIEVFSDIEIKTIRNKADEVEWLDTVLIFIYTGMRISELLALTKFNINFKEGLITGGAKTEAGKNRVVPIHDHIKKYIHERYREEGEFLISRNGQAIKPDYYRKRLYYPALKKAGIRRLSPHKARHTFATMLHNAGVSPKVMQLLLGHADYSTTANIYTHPEIESLKNGIAALK